MTHRTRRRLLAVIAATLMLTLPGCSTAAAPPVPAPPTPTPTRTSTPTPSADTMAQPTVVRAPTSGADAITDANSSLLGYYTASFTSAHAGGTKLDLVAPWITGPALQNEQLLARYLKQKHYRLDGTPIHWTLNRGRSTAGQTQDAKGGTITAFGAVQLVGCAESTNHPVGSGAPAWTTKGKQFPRIWFVLYNSRRQQWLVDASVPVKADKSTPPCA